MIDTRKVKFPAAEKIISDTDVQILVSAISKVSDFFKGDLIKTGLWMREKNPMFGGLRPISLILLGRGNKVLHFIQAAKEGSIE